MHQRNRIALHKFFIQVLKIQKNEYLCFVFFLSQFFLCMHLVGRRRRATARTSTRSSRYIYISIDIFLFFLKILTTKYRIVITGRRCCRCRCVRQRPSQRQRRAQRPRRVSACTRVAKTSCSLQATAGAALSRFHDQRELFRLCVCVCSCACVERSGASLLRSTPQGVCDDRGA